MKQFLYLWTFILLLKPNLSFADLIGYNLKKTIIVESQNLIIVHYHDWSDISLEKRYEMMVTDQNPFTSKNDYAYLACINKSTLDTIFKKPCGVLEIIQISKDENYIVGITKIKIDNPYQLVVFTSTGELIEKRHISSNEARLTSKEFNNFKVQFPQQYEYLKSIDRIYYIEKQYFIDYQSIDFPRRLGEAWQFLSKFRSSNHLSKYFSESVTNYVFWYNKVDPKLDFIYYSGNLSHIQLVGTKNEIIRIPIVE